MTTQVIQQNPAYEMAISVEDNKYGIVIRFMESQMGSEPAEKLQLILNHDELRTLISALNNHQ